MPRDTAPSLDAALRDLLWKREAGLNRRFQAGDIDESTYLADIREVQRTRTRLDERRVRSA